MQPVEVYVDDESKLTLHGLVQHYTMLTEEQKNKRLMDLLDQLDFNQVRLLGKPLSLQLFCSSCVLILFTLWRAFLVTYATMHMGKYAVSPQIGCTENLQARVSKLSQQLVRCVVGGMFADLYCGMCDCLLSCTSAPDLVFCVSRL